MSDSVSTDGALTGARGDALRSLVPVVVALVLYALVAGRPSPFPDGAEYEALTQQLRATGSFGYPDGWNLDDYRRTPGYPVLAAVLGWLAVNLLSLAGLTWCAQRLARRWCRRQGERADTRAAWVATALVATSPGLLTLATVPMTELLFTALMWGGALALLDGRPLRGGALLGLATLTRPIGLLLPVPLAPLLLWAPAERRPRGARGWALALVGLAALAALPPVAWSVRNLTRGGELGYCSIAGANLLLFKAGAHRSAVEGRPFDEVRAELEAEVAARAGDDAGPFARSAVASTMAREYVTSRPVSFAGWALRGAPLFLMPDVTPLLERVGVSAGGRGTSDVLRRRGVVAAVSHYFDGHAGAAVGALAYVAVYLVIGLAALAAVGLAGRRGRWELVYVGIVPAAYFAALGTGALDWRFRMPVTPAIFALVGWWIARSREEDR